MKVAVLERMRRAVANGSGVRLSFEEASGLLSTTPQVGMCVGDSPGEVMFASIIATALEFTQDKKVLVGITGLLESDSTVLLALERDKPLMREHRERMLRAGAYPFDVNLWSVLTWLDLLKGKVLPFQPYDVTYVDALLRTLRWLESRRETEKRTGRWPMEGTKDE